MLQTAWSAFEGRVRSEAPGLLADLEVLASLVTSALPAAAAPTVLRPLTPDATVFVPVGSDPAAPRATAPERYETLALLGRGGMGAVERVWDRRLNRTVARKVMHGSLAASAQARFLAEARATAQLQHPGIVPVYDQGETADGRPWFTMKEVQGDTLRTLIRSEHRAAAAGAGDGAAGLRRLASIVHAVCQAVGYAHARGVVHRDLKPSNVMVGAHGEALVVDWGLAKVLAADGADDEGGGPARAGGGGAERTASGAVMGTPAYMAPEQARGEPVDARSDVYALGAVLYEVLTGTAPFHGTADEVLADVIAGPPPSLRGPAGAGGRPRFGIDVTELVEVCERAMSRAPADRYPDGAAVARAVQSWLDGSRRREQALAVVGQAAAQGPAAAALRARAAALRAEAAVVLASVDRWQPEADKAAGWAQEDEAAALEDRASLLDLSEEQLLQASLTHAPELPEAHAALAERYRVEHAAAEAARASSSRPEALLRQHLGALPEGHPVRRSGLAYLQGDGALTISTDPEGAEVELFRYELRNRRLVAVPDRSLGRTPLRAVSLPRGSYLCVLRHPDRAPVRYPVFLGRGEHWDGVPPEGGDPRPVHLPRPSALGPEDCYVPAGWFWSGGDPGSVYSLPRRRLWVEGQVVRRFPVTNREYLTFLDALVAAGRAEEAARHAPRERSGTAMEPGALIYGFDGRRFFLRPDADGDVWDPEYPTMMVDWFGAAAFAAWEGERTGQAWRLPAELEWEKAARGVDGRSFPWGDRYDPTWACTNQSHRGRRLPAVIDSYPVDESVYGVRGLGGNVRDWCADPFAPDGPPVVQDRALPAPTRDERAEGRVHRGGGWFYVPSGARCANRVWNTPASRFFDLGFRLARSVP